MHANVKLLTWELGACLPVRYLLLRSNSGTHTGTWDAHSCTQRYKINAQESRASVACILSKLIICHRSESHYSALTMKMSCTRTFNYFFSLTSWLDHNLSSLATLPNHLHDIRPPFTYATVTMLVYGAEDKTRKEYIKPEYIKPEPLNSIGNTLNSIGIHIKHYWKVRVA